MDSQKVLSKLFILAKENNSYANAYLLVGENAHLYVEKIVMFITEETYRIQTKNYQDYLAFENGLKKEDVLYLQSYFSKKPAEKLNKKIYSVTNIDLSSIAALNSLLKFLEEPQSDTIAIFTAVNKEVVLPTILSRTQIVFIDDNEKAYDEKAVALFNDAIQYTDIDEMFVFLHHESKKYDFQIYFILYELLIIHYQKTKQYQYVDAFVMLQNEFEKSCNIALVLDRTLYQIKYK